VAVMAKRHNGRRHDDYKIGAENATIKPNGGTFAAMIHIRDNDTFSRPPIDLRGSSCGMRGFWEKPTVFRDYDACAAGNSKYPLLSGGVANTARSLICEGLYCFDGTAFLYWKRR